MHRDSVSEVLWNICFSVSRYLWKMYPYLSSEILWRCTDCIAILCQAWVFRYSSCQKLTTAKGTKILWNHPTEHPTHNTLYEEVFTKNLKKWFLDRPVESLLLPRSLISCRLRESGSLVQSLFLPPPLYSKSLKTTVCDPSQRFELPAKLKIGVPNRKSGETGLISGESRLCLLGLWRRWFLVFSKFRTYPCECGSLWLPWQPQERRPNAPGLPFNKDCYLSF